MQYAILFPINSMGNDPLLFCSLNLHPNAEVKVNAEISDTCRERSVPSLAPGFTAKITRLSEPLYSDSTS